MEIVSADPPVSQDKIEVLLTEFDAEFDPHLSKRVNMKDYAKKLAQNAVWFFVYEQDVMIAHCAVYMNQAEGAFISSIAVKREARGRGIGGRLCLWECVEREARQRGVCRILLRVLKTNVSGVLFYKKRACGVLEDDGGWFLMGKELE